MGQAAGSRVRLDTWPVTRVACARAGGLNFLSAPYLHAFKRRATGPNIIEYKIGDVFGEIKNMISSIEALPFGNAAGEVSTGIGTKGA